MREITIEDYNKVQSARKSKTADIICFILAELAKAKQAVTFSAMDLYRKDHAHYYTLKKAFDSSEEFQKAASGYKFIAHATEHANFTEVLVLKRQEVSKKA